MVSKSDPERSRCCRGACRRLGGNQRARLQKHSKALTVSRRTSSCPSGWLGSWSWAITGPRPFCASETWRIAMLFLNEGFTFRNFLVDVFTVFVFIAWFWLLITVFMDLFRRHDISGWAKAIWVIALIVFPLLAVLAYLITQSRGMAERNTQQAQQARDELRRVVGFSAADEIEKLDRLKKAGSITDAEFARLRAKLVS